MDKLTCLKKLKEKIDSITYNSIYRVFRYKKDGNYYFVDVSYYKYADIHNIEIENKYLLDNHEDVIYISVETINLFINHESNIMNKKYTIC